MIGGDGGWWLRCPRCDWAGWYQLTERYCGSCTATTLAHPLMTRMPDQDAANAAYALGGHRAVRDMARKLREGT